MKAKEKGYQDGRAGNRNDRVRRYQTDKAENDYWVGYLEGIMSMYPGFRIVRCERDGKIFAVDDADIMDVFCPVCARRYINLESDRKLTILK